MYQDQGKWSEAIACYEQSLQIYRAIGDVQGKAALRLQLRKILDSDPDVAKAIAHLLEEDAPDSPPGNQIVQNVTGNQNQVIGQFISGMVLGDITGNVTLPGN